MEGRKGGIKTRIIERSDAALNEFPLALLILFLLLCVCVLDLRIIALPSLGCSSFVAGLLEPTPFVSLYCYTKETRYDGRYS